MQEAAAIARAEQSKRKGLWSLAPRSLEERSIRVGTQISEDGVPAGGADFPDRAQWDCFWGYRNNYKPEQLLLKTGPLLRWGSLLSDANRDNRREHVPAHLKLPVSLHGFLLVDVTGSRVAKETGLYWVPSTPQHHKGDRKRGFIAQKTALSNRALTSTLKNESWTLSHYT